MSMLAEPRRKKQYVLNPRGKALYNDEDRFGSKMLQKMGWTKGKGLGAKESGNIDFVRVNFKSDAAGLGFEDRNDQWTEHEKGFNGLLNALQAVNGKSDNEDVEENQNRDEIETVGFGFQSSTKKRRNLAEEISGQSLEEKSKQSKARVHYKKYTRGKDLSQYTEKDLANIFGKKSVELLESEKSDGNEEYDYHKSNHSINVYFKETTKVKDSEALLSNEEPNILQNSSTSINDYFRRKMQEKNQKNSKRNECLQVKDFGENQSEESNVAQCKSTKRKRKTSINSSIHEFEESQCESPSVTECKNTKRERKTSIKSCTNDNKTQNEILYQPEINSESNEITQDSVKKSNRGKKNKEKKKQIAEHEDLDLSKSQPTKHSVDDSSSNSDECSLNNLKADNDQRQISKSKKDREDINHRDKNSINDNNNQFKKVSISDSNIDETIIETTGASSVRFAKKIGGSETNIQSWESFNKRYNIHQISSFCAEKFRHIDALRFQNSNILCIDGYSLNKDMKLEIVEGVDDEKRISELWQGVIDKYRRQEKEIIKREQGQKPRNEPISESVCDKSVEKFKRKNNLKKFRKHKRKSVFKINV